MGILITGALGQIGTALAQFLADRYGIHNVILTDLKPRVTNSSLGDFTYYPADIREGRVIAEIIRTHSITVIYHLAAILSAAGERMPQKTWDVNINGLVTLLEIAREQGCSVFVPSSIGAFGPSTPRFNTPQVTVQRPVTMYGITKAAGELLCDYYYHAYGVDTRGLRFPGLISSEAPPGGGTTDYAVEIYYAALKNNAYECFLAPDTRLDMMYMPDALTAMVTLMEAPATKLSCRNAYNVTAMNFTPKEQASAIQKFLPGFAMTYCIDPVKQAIADSWPDSLDDRAARADWGWSPAYNLETMTEDMLHSVSRKENTNDRYNGKKFDSRTQHPETGGIIQGRENTYNSPELSY